MKIAAAIEVFVLGFPLKSVLVPAGGVRRAPDQRACAVSSGQGRAT